MNLAMTYTEAESPDVVHDTNNTKQTETGERISFLTMQRLRVNQALRDLSRHAVQEYISRDRDTRFCVLTSLAVVSPLQLVRSARL